MVHSFIRLPWFVRSFPPSFSSRFLIGISYRKRKLIEEFNRKLGSTSVREVSLSKITSADRPTNCYILVENFISTPTRRFDPATRVIVPFLTRDAGRTQFSAMLHQRCCIICLTFHRGYFSPPSLSLFLMTTSLRLNHVK